VQESILEVQANIELEHSSAAVSLLDMPIAKLQIVQAGEVLKDQRFDRSLLEPELIRNADGLWVLTLRRQGEYRQFAVPYIGSEIILADAELGLVTVLVSYHGASAEKYGKRGYFTQKGQFYRHYRQESTGDWQRVPWRLLNDDLRQVIITAVQENRPAWANAPGKLQSERKPPAKPVTMTSYKVVRMIGSRYFSLYNPDQEYVLGERLKEPAKPKHAGDFYSYPTVEMGTEYLADCVQYIPFHRDVTTPQLALLEVEIGGRIINYGHKLASTYLLPARVLEVRAVKRWKSCATA
jgi:hypothetical protein